MATPTAPPHGTLNGWKEIGAYLGKSARTAQRWERDLGLPVQRIPTPDGGAIVFADPRHVDAWRLAQGTRAQVELDSDEADDAADDAASDDTPSSGIGPQSAPTLTNRGAATSRRWWSAPISLGLAGPVVTAIATVAFAAGLWWPASGVPATWEFEGQLIRAYTDGGRRLWTHDFGRGVSRPAQFTRDNGFRGDVDGDGVPEIIVPVRYAKSLRETSEESDGVVAFAADGHIVWSIQLTRELEAAGEVFGGPWYVYDIVAGFTAEGPRTWIAYNHNTWWPGIVLEVDPRGQARTRLVLEDRVHALMFWRTAERSLLLATGALREPDETRGGVVALDVNGPAATFPLAGPSHLNCPDCPTDAPATVVRIPTAHVTRAMMRPHGFVDRGKEVPGGVQLLVNDGFGSGSHLTLSEDLAISRFLRTDWYWAAHRQLEAEGRITHSAEQCPDLVDFHLLEQWAPEGGWQPVPTRLAETGAPRDVDAKARPPAADLDPGE